MSFNKLACTACRSKKIKCDRSIDGCQHCKDTRNQCIYAARRARKAIPKPKSVQELLPRQQSPREDSGYEDTGDGDRVLPTEIHRKYESRSTKLNSGRLFLAPGKSRYINAAKAQQVETLEDVLSLATSGTMLKARSSAKLGRPKLPSLLSDQLKSIDNATSPSLGSEMASLWQIYTERIDPLVKVLYKPDVEKLIYQALPVAGTLQPSNHALLLAVSFAAVNTMSPEESFNANRGDLLMRYRASLGQALLQANWMTTQDIRILQAVVLLLLFSSEQESRQLWIMSGIAVSIAQAMGLHRDGSHFDLSPIESETRRRLWWTLVTADNRISDDCGLEPHAPATMDTALPSNLNDADLDNSTLQPFTSFSESTVTLIKASMAQTVLSIRFANDSGRPYDDNAIVDLAQATIAKIESHMKALDTSVYMQQLCRIASRLIILKLSCLILRHQKHTDLVQQIAMQDSMLLHNVELLVAGYQLPECSFDYGWHFNCKSVQWHAMAYVLRDLDRRQSKSTAVNQALMEVQTIVDRSFKIGHDQARSMEGLLWERLIERAHTVLSNTAILPEQEASIGTGSDSVPTTSQVLTPVNDIIDTEKLDPVLEWLPDLPDYIDWAQVVAGIDGYEAWDLPAV